MTIRASYRSRGKSAIRDAPGEQRSETMDCTAMLSVRDVDASSRWYRELLGLRSAHGGSEFEMLVSDEGLQLLLRRQSAADRPAVTDPTEDVPGRGVLLYFSVEDVRAVHERAKDMGAEVTDELHENPEAGTTELGLRDPDGYALGVGQRRQ
jgi:catechol 2,3-dioxygenase-like lactoylglutathione lyase family enzyme